MALNDLTEPDAVRQAITEYDSLGQTAFLTKYGMGKGRTIWLRKNSQLYDAKAIVAAAHGFQHGEPLRHDQFHSGDGVIGLLTRLGFNALRNGTPESMSSNSRTSELLDPGEVYTREHLKEMFGITDATIITGIFQPKGTQSVWLFVTAQKTKDRIQYEDRLDGDRLHWQERLKGRKDDLIIHHERDGLELLLFYRQQKYEHDGAGFRYQGLFQYRSSTGTNPRSFILDRIQSETIGSGSTERDEFDPTDVKDGRRKIMAAIHRRQGQGRFRKTVLAAYGHQCCITGCSVQSVLEAAHIYPYRGPETNNVSNGLLLRADLHTLFDLGLISVDTTNMTLVTSEELEGSDYAGLSGMKLRLPRNQASHPSKAALEMHHKDASCDRVRQTPVD